MTIISTLTSVSLLVYLNSKHSKVIHTAHYNIPYEIFLRMKTNCEANIKYEKLISYYSLHFDDILLLHRQLQLHLSFYSKFVIQKTIRIFHKPYISLIVVKFHFKCHLKSHFSTQTQDYFPFHILFGIILQLTIAILQQKVEFYLSLEFFKQYHLSLQHFFEKLSLISRQFMLV